MTEITQHQEDPGSWTALCMAAALKPDVVHRIVFRRRRLAIFNLAGELHVTDDACAHGVPALPDGASDECETPCRLCANSLDASTGQPIGIPCTIALATYQCAVRDGLVVARLDD